MPQTKYVKRENAKYQVNKRDYGKAYYYQVNKRDYQVVQRNYIKAYIRNAFRLFREEPKETQANIVVLQNLPQNANVATLPQSLPNEIIDIILLLTKDKHLIEELGSRYINKLHTKHQVELLNTTVKNRVPGTHEDFIRNCGSYITNRVYNLNVDFDKFHHMNRLGLYSSLFYTNRLSMDWTGEYPNPFRNTNIVFDIVLRQDCKNSEGVAVPPACECYHIKDTGSEIREVRPTETDSKTFRDALVDDEFYLGNELEIYQSLDENKSLCGAPLVIDSFNFRLEVQGFQLETPQVLTGDNLLDYWKFFEWYTRLEPIQKIIMREMKKEARI